jgi:glycosyltransferase involved in cell wall biosynthesis
MRILLIHNYYQHSGGEDQVFQAEFELLVANGHQVWPYTLHNQQIEQMSSLGLLSKTLWNQQVYRELRALIRQAKIQIAHFHNPFPLVSPAAYYACKAQGIPVVQTCHNYRLLCPNAMLLRNGQVCEACVGKLVPLAAVRHKCYRNQRAASAGVAALITGHRLMQTWTRQVDTYIALTKFARQKLIEGGLPAAKVVVKPNFVNPDPGRGDGAGGYALFVGRLSEEKGIDLLLAAWKSLGTQIPLKLVGDGPLAEQVAAAVHSTPGLTWVGRKSMQDVYALMKAAAFLVFPSRWYEGLPRTIIESFAVGTPVIAANLGAMASLIRPGETGLHFQSGNGADLIAKVRWAADHPEIVQQWRQNARRDYEQHYTAEQSYRQLLEIYTQAAVGQIWVGVKRQSLQARD